MSTVTLTPTHHAMLFAWLARQVIDQVGDARGEAIILEGVTRYGHERGGRMAQRVQADGQPLDFARYFAYGEWSAEEGSSSVEMLSTTPDVHERVTRCPWCEAWRDSGLMRYGGLYCQRIDVSLVEGYNSDLTLLVGETLTNGGEACDFRFAGANLDEAAFAEVASLKAKVAGRAVMPWRYHCAHLVATMGRTIVEHLGAMGELLIGDALGEFQEAYGDAAIAAVTALQLLDFTVAVEPAELPAP